MQESAFFPINGKQGTMAPLKLVKSLFSSPMLRSGFAWVFFFILGISCFFGLVFFAVTGSCGPGLQAGGGGRRCAVPPGRRSGGSRGTRPPFPAAGAQHGRAVRDKAGRCREPGPPPGSAPGDPGPSCGAADTSCGGGRRRRGAGCRWRRVEG